MRAQRWIMVSIVGCLFGTALLCLALTIAGLAWLYPRWAAERPGAVNRIAYVGVDSNVYTIKLDGTDVRPTTTDARTSRTGSGVSYRYPTWSPDSRFIAFVGIHSQDGRAEEANLYLASVDGGERVTAFVGQQSFPFYLYWSPDSQQIAFLTQEAGGLSLRLGHIDQDREAHLLEQGQPFYLSWSPDSRTLLLHIGGDARFSSQARLSLLEVMDESQPQALPDSPALFQAPAWSPAGDRMLFAAHREAESDALFVADARGQDQQELVAFQGSIAFAWSPTGDHVAYIVARNPRRGTIGPLSVIRADGTDERRLADERVVSFFWSPDARKIAYLVPSLRSQQPAPSSPGTGLSPTAGATSVRWSLQEQELRLTWHIVGLRDGPTRELVTFKPTEDFLFLMPFFDQYTQSLTLWSPDSRHLVYAGRGEDGREGIWVIDTTQEKPSPRFLIEGSVAAWSWR